MKNLNYIKRYQRDYILSNIKLDNFYLLWNCKINTKFIKDIFSYKDRTKVSK